MMIAAETLEMGSKIETVTEKLLLQYPKMEKYALEFEEHYNQLQMMTPSVNENNMYIYINVFQNNAEDEPEWVKSFDENDLSLCYDVSGKDDDEWTGYSLVASKFDEWLGFFVEESSTNSGIDSAPIQ